MAPSGPKRKRGERADNSDPNNRPSPHRPQNLGLANVHQQQNNARGGGGRRGSRGGGRGGANSTPQSPSIAHASPTAMSPPAAIPSSSKPPVPSPTARPQTPSQPSSTVSQPQQQQAQQRPQSPKSPNVPSHNDYLRQDLITAWSGDGRGKVVKEVTEQLVKGDWIQLSIAFEEILQACVDQTLPGEDLGSVVRDILASPAPPNVDPVSIFLDTVSTMIEAGAASSSFKLVLEATGIDSVRMRSELENSLLTTLNLVRPSFSRVAIRKATHALYRQSNYNLLREETEGYSKLITEYFTTVNNEPPSEEVVTETFQRVKALIGAFDLDVGRVLDVTLDVFANLLVKHTRFFVKLLRASSWWPELKAPHGVEWEEPKVTTLPHWASPGFPLHYYSEGQKDEQLHLREERDVDFWKRVKDQGITAWFELGARRITSGRPALDPASESRDTEGAESDKKTTETADSENIYKWSQEWMAETNTLSPGGNRIAAQLLGFKLRFYASDARDAQDMLPENLIYLAALLIKIGFISLVDLYPHLYPLDEDMPAHRDRLMKEKRERDDKLSGKSTNALALAGALPDEGLPPPAPVARLRESESKASSKPESERGTPPRGEEDPNVKLPEPVDQKVALLRSLLCIGAIPEALFILSRFPWLLEVYPDIHSYIFRLAHHSLSKVYEASRPFSAQAIPVVPKHAPSSGSPRPVDYVPRRTLRWAKMEEKDAGDGIDYRFYWEDWMDNVPICQNVEDVLLLCNSLLGLVGIQCGRDAMLLTKLARIAKQDFLANRSDANTRRWFHFSASFLAPALSYSGENPGVVNEVWELIKNFDITTRYSIYHHWFAGPGKTKLSAKFAEATATTKKLFSRISTENTREMGRAIAKPAYASPGLVFERVLRSTENYSNMTEPLVECCRYLTLLGYDCLNWTFINAFKNPRETMQPDGMLIKAWLRHTAVFMGKAYRRYQLMDPTPILQLITDQLIRGNTSVLQILDQLITSMGGIGPNLSLSESQVHGLSAGPLLRAFTLEHYLGDKRHLARGHGKRLMKSLREAGLAPQILIALALELEQYVFRSDVENTPLKVVSTKLDNLHSNFDQYLEFLRTNLSTEAFDAIIPSVVDMVSEYGVAPSLAFTIARESLAKPINAARAERKTPLSRSQAKSLNTPKQDSSSPESPQAVGDVAMSGVEGPVAANGTSAPASDVEMKETLPSNDTPSGNSPNDDKGASASIAGHPNPIIDALTTQLKDKMPNVYGTHICLNFFVTFWQLSLVDIFTSTSMKEMKEYTAAWKYYADKASRVPFDRRDVSKQASEKRQAEMKEYNDQSAAVRAETKDVLETALKTREHLQEEMHHWFDGIPMVDARSEELHDTILQDCFLPRILLSPQDAHFASAMLKCMHELGVPGFRTMKFLDQLFKQKVLTGIFFMCSARESQNLGRFLNDVLKELSFWHASSTNYTKFAQGQRKSLPGFGRTFNLDRTPSSFLDYEDFRRVLYKWHTQLYRAIETCFKSDEFMHIRNAINVQKAIAPNFPKVDTMGKSLQQTVHHLSQNDSRADLKLSAMSLLGDFKKNERSWMSPAVFHHTRNAPGITNASSTASRTGSEQPRTSQPPEAGNTRLSAAAPEFNPQAPTTNGSGSNARESNEAGSKQETQLSQVMDKPEHDSDQLVPLAASSSQVQRKDMEDHNEDNQSLPLSAPPVSRPDSRGGSSQLGSNRSSHVLPARPDGHLPPRPMRPVDRSGERPPEYNGHNRNDLRNNATPEFGRHDRAREPLRDSFSDRREQSPGRGPRGRSPERGPGWGGRERDPRDPRDTRDPRDYTDDRPMHPPPRDMRRPPQYDPRELRDPRHPRDPRDNRGPLPPPNAMDGRGRMHPHSNPSTPDNGGPYRRDHPGSDRGAPIPPRVPIDRTSSNAPSPAQTPDRPMMNPERVALLNDDRGRNDNFRSEREREPRRERDARHPSPRRMDDRAPPSYPPRHDGPRDHRDLRNVDVLGGHGRTPPHGPHTGRDRRDEPTGVAPTGPRNGRTDAPPTRAARDAFLAPHGPRPSAHQAQDPNYGRLNAPAETVPSGPRSMSIRFLPTSVANIMTDPTADRRDGARREPDLPRPSPSASAPVAAPTTQAAPAGIHPSRLPQVAQVSQYSHDRPAPIQTDIPNAPSGPRGSGRTPQGLSPSTPRGAPTGPASSDRNSRNRDGNQLRAITNVLSSNATGVPDERSAPSQVPQIRGRGGRANMHMSTPNAAPPQMGPHDASRPEQQPLRGDRSEHGSIRGDGRLEDGIPRPHRDRDGRRRGRSRSPERSDKPREERSTRNGPEDRGSRTDEQERANDRERRPGRERRGGDRDGNPRDKEREGRERRDRKDDGRLSGRGEEMGSRRGGPVMTTEATGYQHDPSRGTDVRPGRGNERREDRSERRRDEQREDRRDSRGGRKRDRGDDVPPTGDPKRQRR